MPRLQALITQTGNVCQLALLLGVLARRRHTQCLTFALYVPAVVLAEVLMQLWPSRFFRWDFWLLKETAHNILKFAIALELAIRTFRLFPGAKATARRLLFVVVVATGGAVLGASPSLEYERLVGDLHVRILNGTVWFFTAVAVVILWYRLPVNPFHKAILLGFVPYLLVFTLATSLLRQYWNEANQVLGNLHSFAYVLLLAYWTWAAWRRDPTNPSIAGMVVGGN